jgi:hypothetical protein
MPIANCFTDNLFQDVTLGLLGWNGVEGGEFTGRPEIGPDALAPAASLDLRGKI